MNNILRSETVNGKRVVYEENPTVLTLRDYIFNPNSESGCIPGLYDPIGNFLPVSTYCSATLDPVERYQNPKSSFRCEDVVEFAPDDRYLYLGWFHSHYGHFLLSALSRLWNVWDFPDLKILCFSNQAKEELARPHVRAIMDALGIDLSRFASFNAPVKVRKIVLPRPCMEEQSFVHCAFARLCNRIGDRITVDRPTTGTTRPANLSKERMIRGVRRVTNEADICSHLIQNGVDILYPEKMAFDQQVALWREPRPVVGFSSSGLHTSIFSPGSTLICLDHRPHIDSSFALCDWANRTNAFYYHFSPDAFENIGPTEGFASGPGFSSNIRARDPKGVAEAILYAIEFSKRSDAPASS